MMNPNVIPPCQAYDQMTVLYDQMTVLYDQITVSYNQMTVLLTALEHSRAIQQLVEVPDDEPEHDPALPSV